MLSVFPGRRDPSFFPRASLHMMKKKSDSTSVSLPVALLVWGATDLKTMSQYLQANVKTHPCFEAECSEWMFSVRPLGQHKGDPQEEIDKSKSGNTGAPVSQHPPATLTITWPPESSQYLQPLLQLCKDYRGHGSFPVTLALLHRPRSPEWGCIIVL